MSPTKRVKRVSSIRTPRGMSLSVTLRCPRILHARASKGAVSPSFEARRKRGSHLRMTAARLHLLVRVDDPLPVGAGLLQPVLRELVADLLEAGGERVARGLHLHALGLELVEIPARLVLPGLPAARFRGRGGFQDRLLGRLVEP